MAPADYGDFILDEGDDDFFGEYNPHPYLGGYDIAATFGTPLPPSANTCYPISSSAAATPQPEDPPPGEPYGDEEAPRGLVHASPEVFPNGAATEGKVRRRGRGFWRKCVRALDYLFCYKDPYAEKRIGVDNYVVPVYATRKQSGEDALAVEVEVKAAAPAVGRVVPHDGREELVQSNELSWHSNYRDEASTYTQFMSNSYYTPSFAKSYGLPGVLGKPDWFPNFSYSESHQLGEFQHEELLSYNVDHMISGHPVHCYHHHCDKQPLNVQVELPEPISSQRLGYYEHFSTYYDQSDAPTLETPAHAYNIQNAPISDVPLEPFKPSWSQTWRLYDDAPENDTRSLISGEYGGIGSLFISPFYPRESEMFQQAAGDEHTSFHYNEDNLSYQKVYMDDVPLITQLADDYYSMNVSFWPFGEHSAYDV